ncbi:MAG: PAS domain-containing protein [Candidatus Heimdallarchaeota archaeon]|nr:PAS domain-containing protein [Candidatus Heimdallarchaeota archaeon]
MREIENLEGYKKYVESRLDHFADVLTKVMFDDFTVRAGSEENDAFSPFVMYLNTLIASLQRKEEEIKRSSREIKASQERLSTILNKLQAGVVIIDAETHKIVDVNPLAAKMIGTSKEKIIGETCYRFICSAEEGKCPVTDLGQTIDRSEHELIDINGKIIPVLMTAIPITLNNRQRIIGSFVDISKQKEEEKGLKENLDELERYKNVTVDRELRMVELKREINELLKKIGEKPRYAVSRRSELENEMDI